MTIEAVTALLQTVQWEHDWVLSDTADALKCHNICMKLPLGLSFLVAMEQYN
jgi:hypothetical protein